MDILGITLWREARGEGMAGMQAVLHVILNRTMDVHRRWSTDAERVCLEPFQFSCWNTSDKQRNLYPLMGDPQYKIAQQLMIDPGDDITEGATMYYADSIPPPDWATPDKFTVKIGHQLFYRS